MLECKHTLKSVLCFQPYIMALVKSKATFQGVEECLHKSFCPHSNRREFLMREPSPDGPLSPSQVQAPTVERGQSLAQGGAIGRGRGAGVASQGAWVPPENFFAPYFEGIGEQVRSMVEPLERNFDQRFESQQTLQQHFIDPVQASVHNLTEQMGQLATREEVQEIRGDLATHLQALQEI